MGVIQFRSNPVSTHIYTVSSHTQIREESPSSREADVKTNHISGPFFHNQWTWQDASQARDTEKEPANQISLTLDPVQNKSELQLHLTRSQREILQNPHVTMNRM